MRDMAVKIKICSLRLGIKMFVYNFSLCRDVGNVTVKRRGYRLKFLARFPCLQIFLRELHSSALNCLTVLVAFAFGAQPLVVSDFTHGVVVEGR